MQNKYLILKTAFIHWFLTYGEYVFYLCATFKLEMSLQMLKTETRMMGPAHLYT